MKDTNDTKELPEAGATIWTSYKRTDGFEVSLTIRDKTGKEAMERLNLAINKITQEGGVPIPIRGSFQRQEKKVDYVEGRTCPTCRGRLIRGVTKTGKKFIKCENNKWNFQTKQAYGCPFVEYETEHFKELPERDISE